MQRRLQEQLPIVANSYYGVKEFCNVHAADFPMLKPINIFSSQYAGSFTQPVQRRLQEQLSMVANSYYGAKEFCNVHAADFPILKPVA